jgi:type VI secretion system protein ImpA
MPLRSDLLQPIPGTSPAGADLRYDPLYDKIKDARLEDDGAPLGDWERPRKTADFGLVAKLAGDALASRSKDLQLAAWLTEAQLRREGFAGLRDGLELLDGLLREFWDDLYPPLEDGDAELRAAPLAWAALSLAPLVRSVPLTADGHDFFRYRESRAVGSDDDAGGDPKKVQARQQALEEGKLSAEEFDRAFAATPKAWYKAAAAGIEGSLRAVEELDRLSTQKFAEAAPNYGRLQEALTEVQHVVSQLLARKLELDPDPPEARPAADPSATVARQGLTASAAAGAGAPLSAEPIDRDDAAARALAAARFLRRTEPHSPTSYLILRGLRWGELRADSEGPDPRLLEAPPPQARSQLRRLLLEERWDQLLDSAELIMGTTAGRGWLDLQRYALTACAGLGSPYHQVARAIATELAALLKDLPGLSEMSLMDDMPAASRETQQWLREMGFADGGGPDAGEAIAPKPPPARESNGARPGDPVLERANGEVAAGRPERAIELLMEEVAKERSARARFLRRTQIARIMVGAGMEQIAVPILLELLTQIETHALAQWEAGPQVAEPLALLYRCVQKHPDEPAGDHTPASLYPRICSLDPLQAMTLARP